MKVCVLTVDQRASRTTTDLVPAAVRDYGVGALLPFERTAGDEIQGVFTDSDAVATTLGALLRSGAWNVGVGLGEMEEPTAGTARAGRGTAYLNARDAVNRAKNSPGRIAVVGVDHYRARQLETVLWLWAGLLSRRTERGWEVADLVATGLTHAAVADRLGISQSAVSQRASAAGLVESDRTLEVITQYLAEHLPQNQA